MANQSVAVSSRRRNPNVLIAPTKNDKLGKNIPNDSIFDFLPCPELATLIGLAFTAVMADGRDISLCRAELNLFLSHKDFIQYEIMLDVVTLSISQILQSGQAAFRALGYPGYYDDFIWLYEFILKTSSSIPNKIKQEMWRVLDAEF